MWTSQNIWTLLHIFDWLIIFTWRSMDEILADKVKVFWKGHKNGEKIPLFLTLLSNWQIFFSNFLAFSQYPNFMTRNMKDRSLWDEPTLVLHALKGYDVYIMRYLLYNWPSVSCKVRSQMVIHREHNYSIFSPADLKLERGLDVTQNLGGGRVCHRAFKNGGGKRSCQNGLFSL